MSLAPRNKSTEFSVSNGSLFGWMVQTTEIRIDGVKILHSNKVFQIKSILLVCRCHWFNMWYVHLRRRKSIHLQYKWPYLWVILSLACFISDNAMKKECGRFLKLHPRMIVYISFVFIFVFPAEMHKSKSFKCTRHLHIECEIEFSGNWLSSWWDAHVLRNSYF